jgi:hypothetical protein
VTEGSEGIVVIQGNQRNGRDYDVVDWPNIVPADIPRVAFPLGRIAVRAQEVGRVVLPIRVTLHWVASPLLVVPAGFGNLPFQTRNISYVRELVWIDCMIAGNPLRTRPEVLVACGGAVMCVRNLGIVARGLILGKLRLE